MRKSIDNENESISSKNLMLTISVNDLRSLIKEELKSFRKEFESDFASRIDLLEKETLDLLHKLQKEHETSNQAIMDQFIDIKKLIHKKSTEPISQTNITKSNNIKETISDVLNEQELREQKKNNLIIFNMSEAQQANPTEILQCDSKNVLELCTKIGVQNPQIKKVFRIGKQTTNSTRPMVITCTDNSSRYAILSNAKNLKDLENDDIHKKIAIKPDLTKTEQAVVKEVYLQFKRRRAEGESVFLRNGKIFQKTH